MNSHLAPAETDRLMDAAKLRASQLRQQAIDEFWTDSREAARRALRSARRYASSLARHRRVREQSGA